jgi:hypothetical protein
LQPHRNPEQEILIFNPTEATPEERERTRLLMLQWTLEEAAEDFQQLPGETTAEFLEARRAHLQDIETCGPLFKPKESEARQIIEGRYRPPPPKGPQQLKLSF